LRTGPSQTATIWFHFRERDHARTMHMFEAAKRMALGAALMTDTQIDTIATIGSAWSAHFSRPVAEATHGNIRRVGLPQWSEADNTLAKALQRELGVRESGLATEIDSLGGPVNVERSLGGGSDDIGDVSWNLPP
jgi:aminobenzoyl-glutamate utilization protein B